MKSKPTLRSPRRRYVLIVAIALAAAASASAESAVILEQSGEVSVVRSGSTAGEPAVTGQSLEVGDQVSTGSDGSAVLLLADGTRIDLLPSSRLQIREPEPKSEGFLSRLWRSITGKFVDADYASAQAGRVGALRSASDDEAVVDDRLSDTDWEELSSLLEAIEGEELPHEVADLMRAIVYEDYGQFTRAEEIYLARIDGSPDDPVNYDMLLDMYLKIDLYGHAVGIADLKEERLGSE